MVEYINQIAQAIIDEPPKGEPWDLIVGLSEELHRLDPRDFLPGARAAFVMHRLNLERAVASPMPGSIEFKVNARHIAKRTRELLAHYGGEGSLAVSRDFGFIRNPDLRTIIERDYRELSLILVPDGAWKSAVVMAGSILEAILFDRLTDPTVKMSALAAKAAPPKGNLDKGEWKLHKLIEVATEIQQIPAARADAIDTILRDYRNYVHPMAEIRNSHPCTEAEALLAKGALDSVCNHLK